MRSLDFAGTIESVARHLLGEPNKALSSRSELRFGGKGSLSVDLQKDTWYDHEVDEGGGVVDLVQRELPEEDPVEWLKREGYLEAKPNGSQQPPIVYQYFDGTRHLIYEVVRYELVDGSKKIRQRRPDGKGGHVWNLKGIRPLPYRLPELIATPVDVPILVPEGEKKVDALIAMGCVATCNSGGAKKWQEEFRGFFLGRDVVLVPDNDEVGRAHVEIIARSLVGYAERIRVLILPGLKVKGDVIDWLADGGTRDQLDELIAALTDWMPPDGEAGVLLDDFYALMPAHSYIFVPSREMWPATSVDSRIGKIDGTRASKWLDMNRSVEQMTWAPGSPMLIADRLVAEGGWVERRGVSCFNRYRPPTIAAGDPRKASPWLRHVVRAYGKTDGRHIVRWLAHRRQHPEDKINHALVLGGAPGIGKDTLLEPVKRAVGPWNFLEVSPRQVMGRFNGFLKSVILRISEVRDLGDVDRYAFHDHMKAYTAAPPDVLRVDEKNLHEYSILNCCGVIITTNYKDALYLPADDRRHYVAWSELTNKNFPPEYWKKIWSWYDAGGDRHVAAYLAALDLASFDPKAPPPKTPAFWVAVDANRAPEDAELADVLDQMKRPDAVTLSQIIDNATGSFLVWLTDRRNRRIIRHRMEACGYVPVRNDARATGLWVIEDKRQVVYANATLSVRDRMAAAGRLAAPAKPASAEFPF